MALVACRRVISSSPSSSPLGLLASLPPSSSPSCPMCVVLSHLRSMCFVFVLSAPLVSVPPPCSRVVSYRLSPRSPDKTGRGVLCLLHLLLAPSPMLSSRRLASPCSLAQRVIALVVLVPARRRHRLCSCLVAVLISFVFPRSSTSVGGAGVGSLFACLPPFSDAVSPIVRAGGRRAVACLPLGWRTVSSAADCGRRGRWRGSLLALGWRRAMWCRRRVVFGLWCHCLYI